jgi:hypothetical protein
MRFCSMAFIANFHTVPQKLRHGFTTILTNIAI